MSSPHRLRDGLRPCLLVFLAARIGLSLVSVIAVDLVDPLPPVDVPGRTAPPATSGWHNAIDATERQDAVWYLRLADEGWSGEDASAAFFPLYPLTVRAVAWILPGSDELIAALLVSNVAFLGALLALFALTADAFGERVARRAIVVAALFPTAFFFLAPYTESLFLFLSHPRVPRGAMGSLGTRRRHRRPGRAHAERGDPADPGPPGGGVLGQARPQRLPPGARRSCGGRGRDLARTAVVVRVVGTRARELARPSRRPAPVGPRAPAAVGLAHPRRRPRVVVPLLLVARPRPRVDRDRRPGPRRAGAPRSPRSRTGA